VNPVPVQHPLVAHGHLLRVLLEQLNQLVLGQVPLEHVAVVVDLLHLFLDGLLLFGVLGGRRLGLLLGRLATGGGGGGRGAVARLALSEKRKRERCLN
jgi:hypothetical protein